MAKFKHPGKSPSQRGLRSHRKPTRAPDRLRPELIAEAVHRTVCSFDWANGGRGDGFGHCQLYASIGFAMIAPYFKPGDVSMNAGSLTLTPDPERPADVFRIDASGGGILRGEFHAIVVLRQPSGLVGIDLAARHYRRYVEEMPGYLDQDGLGRLRWKRPDPPPYLWDPLERWPSWATFRADQQSTAALFDAMKGLFDSHAPLRAAAREEYRVLSQAHNPG
jgi:hypothetical protein